MRISDGYYKHHKEKKMKLKAKYLKNRRDAINSILEKPKRLYATATFHKLRVEIKKLNAFFDLIKFCSKDFKQKKTFKPFKLIFNHAGKVRELQVEEAMLKKYFRNNALPGYRNTLQKLQLKEKNDYFSVVNKKLESKLKKRYTEIALFVALLDEKKINNYMQKKQNKIEKLLSQESLRTPQVHALRKQLKKFNYNRRSLNLENQKKSLINKDVLQDLLGNWHDCQVVIQHLKKSMSAIGINQQDLIQSETIKTNISSACQELFNKINVAINTSNFS